MTTNDMMIIASLLFIFIGVGFMIPYINSEFNTAYTTGTISTDQGGSVSDLNTISGWEVIKSISSMFVWTFGAVPLWLDLIFLILRIIFYGTIARNIWIGGGG